MGHGGKIRRAGRQTGVVHRHPRRSIAAIAATAAGLALVACSGGVRRTALPVDDVGRPLPEGVTLDGWQPVVAGIRVRRGHAIEAFGLDGVGRPQDLTVVEVDLRTPGLRVVTSPGGGPDGPARPGHRVHTAGGTLHDLVAQRPEVRVAINANFFWPCCELAGGPPVGMTLFGLAMEGGRLVADPAERQEPPGCAPITAVPDAAAVGAPVLLVDGAGRATVQLLAAADQVPVGTVAAVAGGPQPAGPTDACPVEDGYPPQRSVPGPPFLLRGGETDVQPSAAPPEQLAARSFVGVGDGGHRLLLATVDGSDAGGVAFFDEASWLQLLGARDGLNLDGGGSSSLVLSTIGLARPPPSPCPRHDVTELLNVVDNAGRCRERLIGTYLGISTAG